MFIKLRKPFRMATLSLSLLGSLALAADPNGPDPAGEVIPKDAPLPNQPNDPDFVDQWGPQQIHAPYAWHFYTGSYRTVVAVVDTGVDFIHEDLYQNIWLNRGEIPSAIRNQLLDVDADGLITFFDLNEPQNAGVGGLVDVNSNGRIDGGDVLSLWSDGVDTDQNGYPDDFVGWDFAEGDNDPRGNNPHGTHVAGIIGAVGDNGPAWGDGVAGISWDTRIMPVRIPLGQQSGCQEIMDKREDVADAVHYSVDNGARISNHSWGTDTPWHACEAWRETLADLGLAGNFESLYEAFDYARDRGQLVVAAAGNQGRNNDDEGHFPASLGYSNVLAIANTNQADELSSSPPSNYGAHSIDLAAPGEGIRSTVNFDDYASMSGTSMAAPHVAGVAALIWDMNRLWGYQDVAQQIRATVDPIAALQGLTSTGGRLNALAAVAPGSRITGYRLLTPTDDAPADSPLCPPATVEGVRLSLNRYVDPNSFTPDDVLSITGPDSMTFEIEVTGTGYVDSSCIGSSVQPVVACRELELYLTPISVGAGQVLDWGTYRIAFGPGIETSDGFELDLDRDGIDGEGDDDSFEVAFSIVDGPGCQSQPDWENVLDDIRVELPGDLTSPPDIEPDYIDPSLISLPSLPVSSTIPLATTPIVITTPVPTSPSTYRTFGSQIR